MSTRISASTFDFSTLIDLLRWRARQQPEQRIFTFLTDGDEAEHSLTFAELDRQARTIGAWLQEHVKQGERALLIYPSGLEFIAAFCGCLYSGIIAVPVYPPSAARSDRTLTKFRAIARDAQPAIVLTSQALSSRVDSLIAHSPELQVVPTLVTDQLADTLSHAWRLPSITGETLAFLQYTSGSTGIPKGVMVSHANLLHNSSLVERYCQHPAEAHGVTWLPLYHDLGLIGGVLQPLYAGYESTIMAPTSFLQRPLRWLRAVSRTHATISGGPNFAYDLCVRKITPEQKETLDLSHWEIVANGAEPVRLATLERFAQAFASCGFRRAYSYPCYGLAEATLVVSAGTKGVFPAIGTFQAKALEHNQALVASPEQENSRTLVSIGHSHPDQTVIIVNPDTLTRQQADHVGEIWVAGPSIAQGYWHKDAETEQTFRATLSDTGEGPFLRTGDLGFLHDGELFITGRLKDLIIIRGSNHYPQDIEQTVEKSHPALRSAACAAFSLEGDDEEQLVVVQEVERQYLSKNLDDAIAAIRQAIAEQHDLQVGRIIFIKTGSIPKTSSGKIQRRGSREAYLDGTLDIIREWRSDPAATQTSAVLNLPASESGEGSPALPDKSAAEIQNWLVEHVAELLNLAPGAVDTRMSFAYYGMDSVRGIALSADLEDWLGREFSPTLVYDYPTIEALAHHLAGEATPTEEHIHEQERPRTDVDGIAVIGLGCRFPGADNVEAFWQMLRDGVEGITEVPVERWNVQTYYDSRQATPGKMNTRWGGFLQKIDQFDPSFFNISPREAASMDPQQRLLLEVAWETLEHAGQAPDKIAGSQTGVFIGISSDDYSRLQYKDKRTLDAYSGTGNAHSISANRLSYFLDLRGPSMAVDTACSSSLLAVHQACQSLRTGESKLALAGGVNLILTPDLTITFSQARMMSADGHCRTFDEAADGYVRSEGCGLVLLKPLADALADGDTVLAVIRGSAVNQDGRSNGLTAPNGPAQEAVIRQALYNAGVTPEQVNYVETHGSSTPLGDPIEVESLKAVLMTHRSADQPCFIGSVKTNIGHLESAAGIAGLIKTVLCLYKGEIAPHLHLKKLNPHISLSGTPFVIPTQRHAWPTGERRLAGVSAFGFGGTNVHMVVEGPPAVSAIPRMVERPDHLLTLSAHTAPALRAQAQHYAAFLATHPEVTLADVCFTANSGRSHFAHRLAAIATSAEQLREQLVAFSDGQASQHIYNGWIRPGTRQKIVFLFTGQGSQYVGMARQLCETQPTFRQVLERCDTILQAYLEHSLLEVLYPPEGQASPLDETAYTQPALFAFEYALAELWRSWGVEPDVVMGHSVGEYVAACVAGAFSLEDGLKLIATRGRLMQDLTERGEMVTVFAEAARLEHALAPFRERVAIAALNGSRNTVLSGERAAIHSIVEQLTSEGLTTHSMQVSHAFHSPLMDPMLQPFEQTARQLPVQPLRIPLVSNVTGQIMNAGTRLDAGYWRRHVREPVQFAAGMQALAQQGYTLFVEIGPHATLLNMGKRCIAAEAATWLPSLRKDQAAWQTLLNCAATLSTQGVTLNWAGFDRDYQRHRVALPTYPFEREHCWFDTVDTLYGSTSQETQRATQRHPLLESHMSLVYPVGTHVWETALDTQRLPYLKDHRIQGAVALPVSVYIEIAQEATVEAFGPGNHILTDIELKKLLLLPEKGSQKVQVVLSSDASDITTFSVYSHSIGVPDQPRNAWALHATGKIRHT